MKPTVKRAAAILLLTCFLLAWISPLVASAYSGNGDVVVYITKTGSCYHTGSCGYLWKSKIKTTLEEAIIGGYRRCSRCNPPIYTGDATRAPTEPKKSGTGRGSGTGNGAKATEKNTEPPTTQKKQAQENKNTTKQGLLIFGVFLIGIPIAILAIGGVILVTSELMRSSEHARRKEAKALLLKTQSALKKQGIEETLPPVERNKESIDRLCLNAYGLISLVVDSMLKQDPEIVCADGIVSRKGWADNGAVYCVPGSAVYHVAKCQSIRLSNTATKSYAINVAGIRRPCLRCKPPVPTPLMQEAQQLLTLQSKWIAVLNWRKSAKKAPPS